MVRRKRVFFSLFLLVVLGFVGVPVAFGVWSVTGQSGSWVSLTSTSIVSSSSVSSDVAFGNFSYGSVSGFSGVKLNVTVLGASCSQWFDNKEFDYSLGFASNTGETCYSFCQMQKGNRIFGFAGADRFVIGNGYVASGWTDSPRIYASLSGTNLTVQYLCPTGNANGVGLPYVGTWLVYKENYTYAVAPSSVTLYFWVRCAGSGVWNCSLSWEVLTGSLPSLSDDMHGVNQYAADNSGSLFAMLFSTIMSLTSMSGLFFGFLSMFLRFSPILIFMFFFSSIFSCVASRSFDPMRDLFDTIVGGALGVWHTLAGIVSALKFW